jgi:hypothetical protein
VIFARQFIGRHWLNHGTEILKKKNLSRRAPDCNESCNHLVIRIRGRKCGEDLAPVKCDQDLFDLAPPEVAECVIAATSCARKASVSSPPGASTHHVHAATVNGEFVYFDLE